ncbi:disease resistance protein RPV1-like [Gastrolobium bilobum]|uniref:disease resistance protein RPV1-like n=1 Tax=Gastrolobium bilobum TaxID=150636 RepID=UPI002AB06BBE|nr:disease resistance protein RPV1-like [Gastrolobium bilobum]
MAKNGEESCSFTYDVFLSFRGEDTRHTFIGHFRKELRRKGINAFVDDENLRIGEGISPALCKAIEESKIMIIVFSENYASSTWCLDELDKILDCIKRNNKQLVFPIFYHVEPSDVRHQRNHYREAMNAHEDRFGKDSERVQAWRSALSEVANLKGHHISSGYEIYVNIGPKPLHIDQNLVGLESRTEEVKSLLDMKPNDDTVCMLGIYGAGGIGKTALAQALYNKIAHQFEAASFLANVREKSNKINRIEDLQKTLLSEMLEELETELGSTSKGIYEIKRKLHRKKVLLVLDDVDDIGMLEKLAGGCDWFGSGSRVIITTRDKGLLIAHQVEKIYKMTELNDLHSLELFCWNAFKKSHPPTGYEDLSSRAVGYAQGLPLALKVIGSDLAMEQSLDAWECALKEYERIPNKKIQNVLKISFDRLEEHAQQVFLDIACFFKGERIESITKILEDFELRLDNCRNLTEVHESVGFLKNLLHLSVSQCTKLRNFLQRMFLPSLEVLDLNLCIRLEHFPDVVKKMNKPLKIYMINTAVKELPDSVGNLIGLVCIDMPSSRKLRYLPSSLFMLPNVVAFKMGGCSQLRESFTWFIGGPSAAEGRSPLQTLYFENGGLSDEDLHAVLNCFSKLEELIASENNFVSLPACIKESVHLTSLDVSVCKNLKKIPECTNLRILNVHRCGKLEDISDLPSTIQKVDARYCFSLTRETSTMLWSQVSKEIRGLEVVIVNEMAKQSRRQLVELHLVINGQCVPRKGYYNFRIAADHVLLCDLRLLFSNEEWHGLDAFLEHDWNLVQISYEATLSCWGVFVYKQGTKVDDVKFMCPDPKYSDIANISQTIIPTRDSRMEQMKMIESLGLDQIFDGMLMESMGLKERWGFAYENFDIEQHQVLLGGLKEISRQAKDVLESNRPSEKPCGTGSALEDKYSILAAWLEINNKIDDEEREPSNFWVESKPPIDVGEASSSGHQGSGSDPQQQDRMIGIFWEGMEDGLLEAQNSFPSLDIQTTMCAALNKGNRVAWLLPESEVEHHEVEGLLLLPQVEKKIYIEGIFNGLLEAKKSFPTLDIDAILNTVLSRGSHKGPIQAPPVIQQVLDGTTVMVPSSEDPLL